MTAQTNEAAAKAYVKKYAISFEGQDVIVVAFLGVATALDGTASGALLSEYRKFHSLLEAIRLTDVELNGNDDEDDLFSPVA